MVSLTSARCYLLVVLTCISLIISDVEYLFMCLLDICLSSLEKYLFRSSTCFLAGSFAFVCVCDIGLHELFVFFGLILCQLLHLQIYCHS